MCGSYSDVHNVVGNVFLAVLQVWPIVVPKKGKTVYLAFLKTKSERVYKSVYSILKCLPLVLNDFFIRFVPTDPTRS